MGACTSVAHSEEDLGTDVLGHGSSRLSKLWIRQAEAVRPKHTGVLTGPVLRLLEQSPPPARPHPAATRSDVFHHVLLGFLDPDSFGQLLGADRRLHAWCETDGSWEKLHSVVAWTSPCPAAANKNSHNNSSVKARAKSSPKATLKSRWTQERRLRKKAALQAQLSKLLAAKEAAAEACRSKWAPAIAGRRLLALSVAAAIGLGAVKLLSLVGAGRIVVVSLNHLFTL
ncbi:unnamed protein product, partial [Polarella glacialis]